MAWRTFLKVYFKAGGERVSEIIRKTELIGFRYNLGPVDFIYEWKEKPTKNQVLELGDKLNETLKGTDVIFNIDTQ